VRDESAALSAARTGDGGAFERVVQPYLRELRAHCYRMAGSLGDADDLLQESLVRAWRGLGGFEGRSSLRTWLYKVTTRACLDALEKRGPRLLPMELAPSLAAGAAMRAPSTDPIWIGPCPDELADGPASPEARYGGRESVALAFLVALQLLPASQRAVLILRDVVGMGAAECAELLDLSVAAVNSVLQRARETVAAKAPPRGAEPPPIDDPRIASLLKRYVEAWERADVSRLVELLHEDATLAMPPLPDWLTGAQAIGASIDAMVFREGQPGGFRMVPTAANGLPAFAMWRRDPASGRFEPMALHLVAVRDGKIASIVAFLDPALPARFAASGS
jgi:RNA polymerase sigma-70 factor (ECF subfamily)